MSIRFEWLNDYQINNKLIDEQHKQLFDLANQIVQNDRDIEKAKISIMELYTYTRRHFKAEEALMKKSEYPEQAAHIALHDKMLYMLNELSMNLNSSSGVVEKLKIFMMEWLLVHIQTEDMKLANLVDQ